MKKTVLITGSTDGIGLETARALLAQGHRVLLHGRNPSKLAATRDALSDAAGAEPVDGFAVDLSSVTAVAGLADQVAQRHDRLDVLINNAGVYNVREPMTQDGLDVRFAVNTVAPYLLTRRLLPALGREGRVINLSSAAQAPVDLRALAGEVRLTDGAAYAQSKLALTMWSREMARSLDGGPVVVAVNPGSLLASKMVKQAFGTEGRDIRIGVEILCRAALDDAFAAASGQYFDNDSGQFAAPHPDALDPAKGKAVVEAIESILADRLGPR